MNLGATYFINPRHEQVFGMQYGDEGKGTVVGSLAEGLIHSISEKKPDICVRYQGGPNAGHTLYVNGKKRVVHSLPTGILFGIESYIGPGCVIHMPSLLREIEENDVDPSLLIISPGAHLISAEHMERDAKTNEVGTTNKGIGPCYADKALRTGKRVIDAYPHHSDYPANFLVADLSGIINSFKKVLFEGAQGLFLDSDLGNYPFVTSSICHPSYVTSTGIDYHTIASRVGVVKPYETYVGTAAFQGDDPALARLQKTGEEFGATTGRVRQINWFNLNSFIHACRITRPTSVIFKKMDVFETVGVFKYIFNDRVYEVPKSNIWKETIQMIAKTGVKHDMKFIFSGNREGI